MYVVKYLRSSSHQVSQEFLNWRDRSLKIAKHQSRDISNNLAMPGLWEGMRKDSGRFMDVQSRMNCTSREGSWWSWRSAHDGWISAIMFRRDGNSLSLEFWFAGHETSTCSTLHTERQKTQLLLLSESKKELLASQVRNFKCTRSFLIS